MVACTTMGKISYGYRDLKSLSENDYKKWVRKTEGIISGPKGLLDTSFVKNIMLLSKSPGYRKALGQFVVIMAFDSGICKSISSNCYFGGFPNLKWDNGTFNKFPFYSALDDSLCKKIELRNLLASSRIDVNNLHMQSKIIIVICGNSFQRQSRRLLRVLKKTYNNINIMVLNNDNYLYYLHYNSNVVNACAKQ